MKRRRVSGRRIRGRRLKRTRRSIPRRGRRARRSFLNVKRTYAVASWTWGTAATADFWRYFTCTAGTGFNNFAEFANVFDEYKINGIKVTYRPRYDSVSPADVTAGARKMIATYCVDGASTVIPSGLFTIANLNTLLENSKTRQVSAEKKFSIYYKPMVQDGVNGSSSAGRTIRCPWLKTDQTAVPFAGFHLFIHSNNFNVPTVASPVYDQYITVYAQFRNLK